MNPGWRHSVALSTGEGSSWKPAGTEGIAVQPPLCGSRRPLSQDNERTFLKHDLTTLSPQTDSWMCVEYARPASPSTDVRGGLVSTLLRVLPSEPVSLYSNKSKKLFKKTRKGSQSACMANTPWGLSWLLFHRFLLWWLGLCLGVFRGSWHDHTLAGRSYGNFLSNRKKKQGIVHF